MKRVLSTSEIVQDLNLEDEPEELCASAEADYDERRSKLIVKLEAFVRQVRHGGPDICSKPEWLPHPETLRESVGADDASELARDIFQRWTRKVRDAAALAKAR